MHSSEQINELFKALSKAQSELESASLDGKNPHFKSNYATLHSVVMSCRKTLSNNGLCVSQLVECTDKGQVLTTILGHVSGQFISSQMALITSRQDMQSLGSAITYAKRYALMAIIGLSSSDDPTEDDGNNAVGNEAVENKHPRPNSSVSEKQANMVYAKLRSELNLTDGQIKTFLKKYAYVEEIKTLDGDSLDSLLKTIDNLKQQVK